MIFKENSLTSVAIEKILKEKKLKINGIYCRDNLPKDLKKGFYIINLDKAVNGGTHWTAFYFDDNLQSLYFDSYGFLAPEEVEKQIKPYVFNDRQIQDYNSSSCGYFVIAFIYFLSKINQDIETSFKCFINLFYKDTEKNEELLFNILDCNY